MVTELSHGPAGGAFLGPEYEGRGGSVEDVDAPVLEVVAVMEVAVDVSFDVGARDEELPEGLGVLKTAGEVL
jgi:hypothetical protein